MVTSFGGDVTRNGARFAIAVARSSTLGPTGGSARKWSWHPCRTRFVTEGMVTTTCPPPSFANLTAPDDTDHPSAGTSYTTRSGVEESSSGAMKKVPGGRGVKSWSSLTFWTVGAGLGSLDLVAAGLEGTEVRGADVFGGVV